tara:strand:+ start:84 stop:392 length:309 start_codon:yes stop_codon:yes gene_type:complete
MNLIEPLKVDDLSRAVGEIDRLGDAMLKAMETVDRMPVLATLAMAEASSDGFHGTTVTELGADACKALVKLRDIASLLPLNCQTAVTRIDISTVSYTAAADD